MNVEKKCKIDCSERWRDLEKKGDEEEEEEEEEKEQVVTFKRTLLRAMYI